MRVALPRFAICALLAMLSVLAGCASATKSTQRSALDSLQYTWSAAIRWGDFDGAVNLIDPELLESDPPTALELERYKQVQISGYRDVGDTADMAAGTAMRDIEIGVVNRHTQSERTVRYRETWRWDPDKKTWWLTSGLPDLWAGQ